MPRRGIGPRPTFRFEATPPLIYSIKGISVRLRAALEAEGKIHRDLLRKTTADWTGTKPQFRSKVTVSKVALTISTGPFGQGEGAKKWRWLEFGTRIRWALMSSDWKSKTRRAWLGSGRGAGRVLIAGKRAMMRRHIKPRPGIQARNFLAEVNKARSRKFKGQLQRQFGIIATNTIKPKSVRRP